MLNENVLLLRWLYIIKNQDGSPTFSKEMITALFRWFVHNSQFVQEREKRFIATAWSVCKSDTFPYSFTDEQKQSIIDRMAAIPRNYMEYVILPFILDLSLDSDRWQSAANKHLETAMPKAGDALFFISCNINWDNQQRPRDADGRPVHRISRRNKQLKSFFEPEGFGKAVTNATDAKKKGHKLFYASAPATKSSAKTGKKMSRRDTQQLLKILNGTNKPCYTRCRGVKGDLAEPTCGSRQNDSGNHTKQRYDGVADALQLTGDEKEDAVSLFVDVHEAGNTVGKEKLTGKNAQPNEAKACGAIRPVELYDEPELPPALATKRALGSAAMSSMVPLGKRRATTPSR